MIGHIATCVALALQLLTKWLTDKIIISALLHNYVSQFDTKSINYSKSAYCH